MGLMPGSTAGLGLDQAPWLICVPVFLIPANLSLQGLDMDLQGAADPAEPDLQPLTQIFVGKSSSRGCRFDWVSPYRFKVMFYIDRIV